jgi:hypothetical protein
MEQAELSVDPNVVAEFSGLTFGPSFTFSKMGEDKILPFNEKRYIFSLY